jgi:glutaredoxin
MSRFFCLNLSSFITRNKKPMKKLIALFIGLHTLLLVGQEKKVKFKTKKGTNTISFLASNKTNFDQEVTLYFNRIEGLYGYSKPITKVIPAENSIEFLTLRFAGKYSYNYTYSTRAKPTKQQQADWDRKVESYNFLEGSNLEKGIVLFSKDGCSRCKMSVDYLIEHQVDFQIINISDNKKNQTLMWQTLRRKGEKMNRVSTPVILVEGKPFHKFDNLKEFLKKLSKE